MMTKAKISPAAANRIMQKVSMPMKEFKSEHRRLVKILKSGSLVTRKKEAMGQAKELEEY